MTEVRVIRARHVPWQGRTIAYPKGWTGDVADDLAAHLCDSLGIARRTATLTPVMSKWPIPLPRKLKAKSSPLIEAEEDLAEPLGLTQEAEDDEPDDLPVRMRRTRRV